MVIRSKVEIDMGGDSKKKHYNFSVHGFMMSLQPYCVLQYLWSMDLNYHGGIILLSEFAKPIV